MNSDKFFDSWWEGLSEDKKNTLVKADELNHFKHFEDGYIYLFK